MSRRQDIVADLRRLIVESAPDTDRAKPVLECSADRPLDEVIPFSSVIVLGTIIAIEDHFDIRLTKQHWTNVGTATLDNIAAVIEAMKR